MALLYEEKITENKSAFIAKLNDVADKLSIPPSWLTAVMNFESNLNSKAVNTSTGATGLIQFMPATAIALGTTTEQLYNMSNVAQLDYVYKYYQPYKSKLVSVQDLYLATFFPAALTKADSYVLRTDTIAADTIARQNPIFDSVKKGYVTVGDVRDTIIKSVPAMWVSTLSASADGIVKFAKRNWVGVAAASALILSVTYLLISNRKAILK